MSLYVKNHKLYSKEIHQEQLLSLVQRDSEEFQTNIICVLLQRKSFRNSIKARKYPFVTAAIGSIKKKNVLFVSSNKPEVIKKYILFLLLILQSTGLMQEKKQSGVYTYGCCFYVFFVIDV